MDIEVQLEQFAKVDGFVCPAEFWPALGYTGEARYVGIWWEQCGDEASWSDGRSSVVGADWPAYLELIDHNFLRQILPGRRPSWVLGSSEDAAEFRLIIDRETERVWFVPYDEAEGVLKAQWPSDDDGMGVVTFEGFESFVEAMRASLAELSDVDVEQAMNVSDARYEALVAALEERREANE